VLPDVGFAVGTEVGLVTGMEVGVAVGVAVVVLQAMATRTRTASAINNFLFILPPLQNNKRIWIYFVSIHEIGGFANLQALNRILNRQIK
jgi:hypothetical protein